jgi:transposase InsO family protein
MSDITYLWTAEGWLYLAVVLDLFSRTIVGWSTGARIDAELVCRAINVALIRYRPTVEAIFHSDRGSQYTSDMLRKLLTNNPSAVPIASHGSSCYDDAVVESFFHTMKCECTELEHSGLSRGSIRRGLFDYIEVFYNRKRLHSSIGYLTPFEKIQSYEVQGIKNLNSLSEETGQ